MNDPYQILILAGGLLICFLAGYWFTSLNNTQKESSEELKKMAVSHAKYDLNIKRLEGELKESRKKNADLSAEMKEKFIELSGGMTKMTNSIEKMVKSTMIHDVEIKNTKTSIKELKDQNTFITNNILKKSNGS